MNLSRFPETAGVYLFKNGQEEVIYVGKAKNLKNRLKSYFQSNLLSLKTSELVKRIRHCKIIKTETEFEALLLEAKLIRKYRPKYNILAKDDKRSLFIKITSFEFPKIQTVRKEDDDKATYFGPFMKSRNVFETLKFLRRIFPYCAEKKIGKKPCFYSHLKLCYPCPNMIVKLDQFSYLQMKKVYLKNIFYIRQILEGKSKKVIKSLEKQMKVYAKKLDFENAQKIKLQLEKLNYLITNHNHISSYMDNPNLYDDLRKEETTALAQFLSLPKIKSIEGYDISNISGKNAAGSMVSFTDGEADKSKYRRFKIKKVSQIDDTAMIVEVVKRRLKNPQWKYPDLILIDGGKSQAGAVYWLTLKEKINIPVIGLAKKLEEIIVPFIDGKMIVFKILRLPKSSPALKLLQRIRDEAHRFAKTYHLQLRKKSMLY